MSVFIGNTSDAAREIREAYQSNDSSRIETAWENMQLAIGNDVMQRVQGDLAAYQQTKDESILASRGYRKLTSKEEKWYQKVIDAMKSANPKQRFIEIIGSDDEDDIMPTTIIEDVLTRLQEEHPLLSKLNVINTGYATKWILNNHTAQQAAWGSITADVEKEITSALKVVDIKQNKLSCFAILERGMLDLGPTFLDNYVRTCMYETMATALEFAAVSGTGINMPIGMDRDLGATSFNANTGWAKKTAVSVPDLTPATYGTLLAQLAKDEQGKTRKLTKVILICNQADYFAKIMPATTVLSTSGTYVNNLLPYPTDVIVSNVVADGEAILGVADEYYELIGQSSRNNVIEYSDEYKFIEDQRVFKVVQYADGRPYDNTSFVLLDISKLNPAYITVQQIDEA